MAFYGKNKEDTLPKMVLCGSGEEKMPKLLVCQDENKPENRCRAPCSPPAQPNPYQNFQSYPTVPPYQNYQNMQPSMPQTFQPKMYPPMPAPPTCPPSPAQVIQKLQAELCAKDQIIENLKQTLCSIECEMDILKRDNEKIRQKIEQARSGQKLSTKSCSKYNTLEDRMMDFSQTTKLLEEQVKDMEKNVQNMKNELSCVQANKKKAEQKNQIIMMYPPCPGVPICPTSYSECS